MRLDRIPGASYIVLALTLVAGAAVPCVIFLLNKDPYVTEFPKP